MSNRTADPTPKGAPMPPHWHSYTWTGHGSDLGKSAERRAFGGPTFQASMIPPEITAEWLLRPRTAITATYDTPEPAAAWLAEQYQAKPPEQARATVEENRASALASLSQGTDFVIGHYLPGAQSAFHAAVICCPNRMRPDLPCPEHRAV
jgi:hypothetical protein